MRLEGKVSKVAICNGCNKMILASHIDYIDKTTEKEFTQFTNEGFLVKIETIEETKKRDFGSYEDCSTGKC
jgi:hypothetical protein